MARIAIAAAVAGGLSAAPAVAIAKPAKSAQAKSPAKSPARSGRVFLRVEVDRGRPFVGEAIPVKFKAYFRSDTGATVKGAPRLAGAELATSEVSGEFEQKSEVLGGVGYRVAEWKGTLSPVKPGSMAISAKLPATIRWHEIVRRKVDAKRRIDPIFEHFLADDPAFAGMLGALEGFGAFEEQAVEERSRELVLESAPVELDVRDLPLEGKPEGFSGAVGRFAMEARVEPERVRAGEPVTVSVTFRGEGSFDRVSLEGIEDAPGLRAYAPSVEAPAAEAEKGGEQRKTFSQVVVPTDPSITSLPPIRFSYFDPREEKYVTLESEALPLEVSPAPAPDMADASGAHAIHPPGDDPVLGNGPEHRVATLAPPHRRPRFWLQQLLPLGALALVAGGTAAARRRERGRTARAAREAIGARLAEMRAASRRGDAGAFFVAAGEALRERVGARLGVDPRTLTPADVEAQLGERADALRLVLQGADSARYGCAELSVADVDRFQSLVEKEISS